MNTTRYVLFFLVAGTAQAQVTQFPYFQNFDSVSVPNLPSGWSSTQNRTPGTNDFTTSTASPRSLPNAVLSTNPRVSQSLISPLLDFSGQSVDSILFFERRSNTDTTGVLVEASIDGGVSFGIVIGDTLQLTNPTNYVRRVSSLPASLSGMNNVKIRWRVLGDPRGGSTGTLRLDDILITTVTQFDIGVSSVNFTPLFPRAGDSVIIYATAKNYGRSEVQNFVIRFYEDANLDSLPEPNELNDSVVVSTAIAPGDSISVSTMLGNVSLGDHQFIVQAALPGDQNPSNDRGLTRMTVGLRQFSVSLNELMYAPPTGEPEWVEFFNSLQDTINLKNWKISNRNTSSKYLITSIDIRLGPQQLALITKDTALLFAAHPNISSTVVQSSSMPTFLFNNNGDAAVLFDQGGGLMDTVHYAPTWGGVGGRSLERIESGGLSGDSTNWGSSADSSGSTPGRQNSLTPVDFDLRAVRLNAVNTLPDQPLDVTVLVANVGRQPAMNFSVSLFHDADADSVADSTEVLGTQQIAGPVQQRDSLSVQFIWGSPGYGLKALIARVDYSQDLRVSDNTVFGTGIILFPPRSLIINEIMYAPLTGGAEYLELYNRGVSVVDVRGWLVHDMRDAAGNANEFVLTQQQESIQPGEYVVVASDSSILLRFNLPTDSTSGVHLFIMNESSLSLNNQGDDVVLVELAGGVIDSLRYAPDWHNPQLSDATGRSLERINPEFSSTDRRNWSTSAGSPGGTPGGQNSIYAASVPASALLSFSPNPFSPDGDGFEDFTIVSYEVPATAALLRVRIYDATGRLIRTLASGEPTGARGNLIWDGMNDNRDKVRMGIYIVLLEALDANGGTVHSTKGVVVVAVKL